MQYRAYIKKGQESASSLHPTPEAAFEWAKPYLLQGFKVTISEAKRSPLFRKMTKWEY